ncbi:DNA mismatch repair protein MutS [Trichinella pseudospiralis]
MPDSTKWLASASCFLLLRQHLLHCNQNLAPYTGKFYPNNCHGNGLGEQDVRLPYSQSATRIRALVTVSSASLAASKRIASFRTYLKSLIPS